MDLADGSSIAVFSCYEYPERANPPRMLIVESKEPGGERFEIPLTHHGVVVFDTQANRRHRHQIVLRGPGPTLGNRWLGVTFRTSKTVVTYHGGRALFADGADLTLADEERRRMFFAHRRRENHETDFAYPRVDDTVSESDLLPPDGAAPCP